MNKLIKEKKQAIKAGASVSGIVNGVSALIYSATIILGMVAEYALAKKSEETHIQRKEPLNAQKYLVNHLNGGAKIIS